MKLIQNIIFAILSAALAGCVTPIPLAEQTPQINYQVQDKVVISVVDNRQRVKAGKPKDYVGKAHAAFGIPVDWHVNQVLATEKGDKGKNLSQFLEHRLTQGLIKSGWNAVAANNDSMVKASNVNEIITQNNAKKMFVLDLQEWYFSINLNWVTAFNFDTNATIYVYEINDGKTLEKVISARDVIEENASESPQNNVLRAYRDQLIDILNDEEVKNALIGSQ